MDPNIIESSSGVQFEDEQTDINMTRRTTSLSPHTFSHFLVKEGWARDEKEGNRILLILAILLILLSLLLIYIFVFRANTNVPVQFSPEALRKINNNQ